MSETVWETQKYPKYLFNAKKRIKNSYNFFRQKYFTTSPWFLQNENSEKLKHAKFQELQKMDYLHSYAY